MWRDKVYSGTLRPQICTKNMSGVDLDALLNEFTRTIRSNPSTRISNIHSVDKIDNGLYLGDKYAAKDKRFLVKNGFTHVLNAAQGIDEFQVNTDNHYYTGTNIKYFGIPGHDRPSWNISVYFEQASKFIHNAVINGGKVLVHCIVGISRSATLVIAYLMIMKNQPAAEALEFVFRRRRVFPNIGFLHHLAHLDMILRKRIIQPNSISYYY